MESCILPSILVNDKQELKKKIKKVMKYPLVHIDIADGIFVRNKTVQPIDFPGIKLPMIEFHLMVQDVDHYIEHVVRLNAASIVFHVEACKSDEEVAHVIRHIKSHDSDVGLAINPETSPERIKKFVKEVDKIIVMTVHPGFGGQKFMPKMLEKIAILRKLNKKVCIEVDGGINEQTVALAAKAGANMFVVGSALFKARNIQVAFERISERQK